MADICHHQGVRILFLLCLLVLSSFSYAALMPGYHQAAKQPESFISSGVFIGGVSFLGKNQSASLLDVKVLRSKNKKEPKERIFFEFGDQRGRVLPGLPTYFQVSMENDLSRIVLDFSRVQKTAVSPEDLVQALSRSHFVKNSQMTMDPEDRSTNITLILDRPIEVSTFLPEDKKGRIYLELRPLKKK